MEDSSISDTTCLGILLRCNCDEISNFCSTSHGLQKLICSNPNFWYSKFKHDFPVQARSSRFQSLPTVFENWKQVIYSLQNISFYYQRYFQDFCKIPFDYTSRENSIDPMFPILLATDSSFPQNYLKIVQRLREFGVEFQINSEIQKREFRTIDELRNRLPYFLVQLNQLDVREIILQDEGQIISRVKF